ncbi:hypothetical protein [Nocardioides xinjiangensis]|uniref:hypothetical protein n=1 Tax=Nocardioides xinjiangensis TaxID=2817376 RepID=UPI001B30C524|nr:hypothetical protein [Nocardioides sp. SYSU D00778]
MCSYRMGADYAKDITTMWVSRRCLDDPAKVRAAIRVSGGIDPDFAQDWVGERRWTDWLARA